jgi:hypothetical protein
VKVKDTSTAYSVAEALGSEAALNDRAGKPRLFIQATCLGMTTSRMGMS